MSSPTKTTQNAWNTTVGQDFLQLSQEGGGVIAGIDSTGAGFGALASSNNPAQPTIGGPSIVYATSFGVKADTQYVLDATFTNGLHTVSSATANFKPSDTGKTCYGLSGTSVVMPVGTFTYVSPSQGTCTGTGTAGSGSSQTFVWGTDDTAALAAAYAQTLSFLHSGTLILPAGYMMISGPIFTAATPAGYQVLNQNASGVNIIGQGDRSTFFIARPDCTFDGTTRSVIGGYPNVLMYGFQLMGLGMAGTNTANKFGVSVYQAGSVNQVAVTQMGVGISSFAPFTFGGQQNAAIQCYTDGCGGPVQIATNTQQVVFVNFYSSSGLNVGLGASMFDFGSLYNAPTSGFNTPHQFSGTYDGTNCAFVNNILTAGNAIAIENAAAKVTLRGPGSFVQCNANAGSQAVYWPAAGILDASGVTFIGGATAGDFYNVGVAGATFYDHGNNIWTNGFANWNGIWQGMDILQGSASGVASSSSTLGLYGLGQFATLNGTSTTVSLGQVMTKSGTLRLLKVTATAGGVNASSGVFTVLKNGSTTALTCTIGTGTSAIDNTHSVAYVAGDVISIQFTTQGSETLAGVVAQVIAQ